MVVVHRNIFSALPFSFPNSNVIKREDAELNEAVTKDSIVTTPPTTLKVP